MSCADRRCLGLVLILSWWGWPASATAGDSFADANAAYQAQDYDAAIHRYEALVATGVTSAVLYYNLGNAYYRSAAVARDRLGHAIFNYERALRLDQRFEDARFNLEVARAAVAARLEDRLVGAEQEPVWIREATRFTIGQLAVAVLFASVLFFGGLLVIRFAAAGFLRTGAIVADVFVGLAGVWVVVLFIGHIVFLETVRVGVVVHDELVLREGPDRSRADTGQVHAGLRVRVVDRDPGWVRVRLANGVEGWLPEESIGEL